jgi:hypothetical protein
VTQPPATPRTIAQALDERDTLFARQAAINPGFAGRR